MLTYGIAAGEMTAYEKTVYGIVARQLLAHEIVIRDTLTYHGLTYEIQVYQKIQPVRSQPESSLRHEMSAS